MLRRSALALSAVLFLLPGNLVAGALQRWAEACDVEACCCPEPERQDSIPSITEACCCEAQPAQAPKDRPNEPLQAPHQQPPELAILKAYDAEGLALAPLERKNSDAVVYRAQAPPGPLFLRYQNLRL